MCGLCFRSVALRVLWFSLRSCYSLFCSARAVRVSLLCRFLFVLLLLLLFIYLYFSTFLLCFLSSVFTSSSSSSVPFFPSAPASYFFVFLPSSTARVSSLCPCRHAEGLNMFSIHLKLSCRTAHCAGQFTLLSAPCANSSLFPFGYSWVPFLYWPFLLPCMSCSGSLGLTCCKLVECFLDILVLLSLHMNTFHDVIWSHLGWLDITPRATGFQLIVCYFAVSSTASICKSNNVLARIGRIFEIISENNYHFVRNKFATLNVFGFKRVRFARKVLK